MSSPIEKRLFGVDETISKVVFIDEVDIWIGTSLLVLYGVNIEQGAVIATSSVEIKYVPSYFVDGGAPARIVK